MATAIPTSPEPEEFPDWVLLEYVGRTHRYVDPDAAAAAVENDATAVAVETSCNHSGYLSFTLRPPSKISYLDLHWPYDMGTRGYRPDALCGYPTVLGADESHVLIRILAGTSGYLYSDLFVYTACPSPPPSLLRLPSCNEEAQGLASRTSFLNLPSCIGILCRGRDQDDYVVADLIVSWKARGCGLDYRDRGYDYSNPTPMMAAVCFFHPKKGVWTVNQMLAPQPQSQSAHSKFPVLWYCDSVLPLAGRFLCWVDYYHGVLLCDFFDENSPVLSYSPLPDIGMQYSDQTLVERNCPESFRGVSVSKGMLHFVHIGDDDWRHPGGPCQRSGPTITMWTLKMTDDSCEWEMDYVIKTSDLWAQPGYQAEGLPRRPPEFPAVTKNHPYILCCLLREEQYGGRMWIIMVDMKRAALISCVPYINELDLDSLNSDDFVNIFMDVPLVLSDFSKYLNKAPGLSAIIPQKKKAEIVLRLI